MLESSFSRPLLRFHALGVPVRVELTFLLTTVLLAGDRREGVEPFVTWVAVVFASVLAHELGHALVGRRFGLAPDVRLYGWGGLTSWTAGDAPSPARRVAIAVAGPFVGIALGLAAGLVAARVSPSSLRVQRALADLVWASGVWGACNLLPILPLDGGLALEAVLEKVSPGREARVARIVSAVTGFVAGALAVSQGFRMAGVLAAWLGFDNARRAFEARRERADEALRERVAPALQAALDAEDGALLVAAAKLALPQARTDPTRTWLAEHLALGHALSGAFPEAAAALAAAPPHLPPAVTAEAFVVALAVGRRKRQVAVAMGGDPEVWADAGAQGAGSAEWEEACALLRGPRDAEVEAAAFGRAREAAEILGREGDAAALGEGLLARAPDPDLAFAVAAAWARAGDAARAAETAGRAVTLGFRDWERVEAGGEAVARAFAAWR